MGDLVVFRRKAGSVPLDAGGNHPAVSPGREDWPEALDTGLSQQVCSQKSASSAVFRRLGMKRFVGSSVNTGRRSDLDGYLLVLLADQEFTAGRDRQAQSLLDAAYAAFDRQPYGQPTCAAQS